MAIGIDIAKISVGKCAIAHSIPFERRFVYVATVFEVVFANIAFDAVGSVVVGTDDLVSIVGIDVIADLGASKACHAQGDGYAKHAYVVHRFHRNISDS